MLETSPYDVQVNVRYWDSAVPPQPPIDFRQPDAQQRFQKGNSFVEDKDVTARNIRGQEEHFSLSVNGFKYVQHALQGDVDWNSDDQIKEKVYPQVEDLVKKM